MSELSVIIIPLAERVTFENLKLDVEIGLNIQIRGYVASFPGHAWPGNEAIRVVIEYVVRPVVSCPDRR